MRHHILFAIFAAAFAVSAVSCSEKLDPVEPLSELKYQRGKLFSDYEDKYLEYTPWERTKSGEGLSGNGASFQYWNDHKIEATTYNELWSMCEIPAAELQNMSTRNLVRSCYIYPYNSDLLAYWDVNLSFLDGIHHIMSHFNGYRELYLRKDSPKEMLDLFKEVKYSDWDGESFYVVLESNEYRKQNSVGGGISSFSMVLASAVDNKCFSETQIAELSKSVIKKIDEVKKDSETYSGMTAFFPYLLGAVLSYHYDNTLSEEKVHELEGFIQDCYRAWGTPSTYDSVYDSVRKIAKSTPGK